MANNQQMLSWTYQKVNGLVTSVQELKDDLAAVWGTPIRRNGKPVSALQELADCKTLALENKDKLDAIIAKLNEGA